MKDYDKTEAYHYKQWKNQAKKEHKKLKKLYKGKSYHDGYSNYKKMGNDNPSSIQDNTWNKHKNPPTGTKQRRKNPYRPSHQNKKQDLSFLEKLFFLMLVFNFPALSAQKVNQNVFNRHPNRNSNGNVENLMSNFDLNFTNVISYLDQRSDHSNTLICPNNLQQNSIPESPIKTPSKELLHVSFFKQPKDEYCVTWEEDTMTQNMLGSVNRLIKEMKIDGVCVLKGWQFDLFRFNDSMDQENYAVSFNNIEDNKLGEGAFGSTKKTCPLLKKGNGWKLGEELRVVKEGTFYTKKQAKNNEYWTNELGGGSLGSCTSNRLTITDMPYKGKTISALSLNKLPLFEKSKIGIQLFKELSYLHEKGFYHGDIHSKNVLIDSKGKLSLIDFDFVGPIQASSETMEWSYSSIFNVITTYIQSYVQSREIDLSMSAKVLLSNVFSNDSEDTVQIKAFLNSMVKYPKSFSAKEAYQFFEKMQKNFKNEEEPEHVRKETFEFK